MPDEIVKVGMRDQIPKEKIDKKKLALELSDKIRFMNDDRKEWLDRQNEYLSHWDDYITQYTEGLWKNSANFHLPITMVHCLAQHSRLLAAIFGLRPFFNIVPREKLDIVRIKKIDQIMQWTLSSYCNNYKGIYNTIDDWLWDVVTVGWGVLKVRWDLQYRKSTMIENEPVIDFNVSGMSEIEIRDALMQRMQMGLLETKEVEKSKFLEIFNGPMVETIDCEDIIFPAGIQDASDLNQAHVVAHRLYMSAHDLKIRAQSGIFDTRAVNKILKLEPDNQYNNDLVSSTIKMTKDTLRGVETVNAKEKDNTYTIYEIYTRYDVDNDGYAEEIVVWLHDDTNTILRWTYLDRISPTGTRPFFKGDLFRRPRNAYSMGMVELLYQLNKEADALHNQRIDFGSLTNMPFGFVRAAAGLKPELITIEPGKLIPVEDTSDVRIAQFPNSTNWGFQEEGLLQGYAEKLTSITEMASGSMPSPIGGAGTATGMLTLMDQANKQLNVRIKRIQKPFEQMMKYVHSLLVERMPIGMQYRVINPDGSDMMDNMGVPQTAEYGNKFELVANIDFELLCNSENTNREVEKQNSMLLSQLLMNPIGLQLGLINPYNIYNIYKNVLDKYGIVGQDKFLTKPQEMEQPLSLYDEIASCNQGLMPRIVLNDNHETKIQGLQQYLQLPEHQQAMASGYIHPNHMALFQATMIKHQNMLQVIQAQAQTGNVTGLQISPSLGARVGGQVNQQTGKPLAQPPQQPQQQEMPNMRQGQQQ